ncbi:MAG TPA: helicase C-terminal domain-containing protein [Gemmatimonadaceae bacterium]|nr:helicase C-terminal domain-containing protein [Gemmatimonadaceae bacterium]
MPATLPTTAPRLTPKVAAAIRAAIQLAGGREVCFACGLAEDGTLDTARVVARGDAVSVLALPGFARRGQMLVHNHPSGVLTPSDADNQVAARIYDDGIGFAIVDNDAENLYVVVEVPSHPAEQGIARDEMDHDLGVDGPIAKAHPRYEDRPSQRAMATRVAQLYTNGGIGLLEAGTGVGKSLGYLVPALRWASRNAERTIVSTNTINLQEQLVGKDLPFLKTALDDQKVRFALLKGWRNYLCLMRLETAQTAEATLFDDGMREEIAQVTAWASKTKDGSLSDLPSPPRNEVWDEVAAEPDLCQRFKCSHFEKCFVFRARRIAAEADVIVVNHHLLLSDVAVRRMSNNWEDAAVLPAYSRLVIDEGHHLEDAAASHLGVMVTRQGLQRLFARLERRGRGLLPSLVSRLASMRDLLSVASVDLVEDRLGPAVRTARDKAAQLFDLLDLLLDESGAPVLRLTDAFATHRIWESGLRIALQDTCGEIGILRDGLQMVRERLEANAKLEEATAPLIGEIRAVVRRLDHASEALRETLHPAPGADTVRWLERKGRERSVAVTSVPLDLAPMLREHLFDKVSTCVVTSATLATDGNFTFLRNRLGLNEEAVEPMTAVFPSPFLYDEQALLAIPTDAPLPNGEPAAHTSFVLQAILDVAEASDGGMFVLFTSHKDVRLFAAELRARGFERRWPLLVHGETSRDSLLERFRASSGAVLLGTASFWEGVDVPGRALRGLVISKLPFKVPTEPLTAAHCEAIERAGGDAFAEYMLPHAALRLKQGFGRLIRSSTDSGVVVIADARVIRMGYGRELLRVLPPARRVNGRWTELREEIQRFYRINGAH